MLCVIKEKKCKYTVKKGQEANMPKMFSNDGAMKNSCFLLCPFL